jgi:DNA-binding GntR family transcriptional regulator
MNRLYMQLDHYVLAVLMRDLVGHDKRPSAFVVYMHLWQRTLGAGVRSVRASHAQIAGATGLSKSAVQSAVRHLARRRLLQMRKRNPTSVPQYTLGRPWRNV